MRSIIDGIKLSGLEKVIYKHLDIADLEKRLEEPTLIKIYQK